MVGDVDVRTTTGRYRVYDEIASGGMAVVHLGRLFGPGGFSRVVAIKRLHARLACDPRLVQGLLDEARIASRVRHPNVVAVIDVVRDGDEVLLIMDYVHGVALSWLRKQQLAGQRLPPDVASSIACGVLFGLDAAHGATSEAGAPLAIVHRDVSPQNVMVGADGLARVIDFGIARAANRARTTQQGTIKGKLAYFAPELLQGAEPSRASDIYGAAVVAWESFTGQRLFGAASDAALLDQIAVGDIEPPSKYATGLPPAVDDAVLRGLSNRPGDRFESARDFALALEAALPPAPLGKVAELVRGLAADTLAARAEAVRRIESLDVAPEPAASRPEPESAPAVPAPPAPRRTSLLFKVSVSLSVAGVAVALLARGDRSPAPPPLPPPLPSTAPAPLAVSSPEGTGLSPPVSESLPPGQDVEPLADPPPAHPATAKKHFPVRPPSCDPPYTIDASGKRTYKRGCLF
jgi:serine/threonine protein kinase